MNRFLFPLELLGMLRCLLLEAQNADVIDVSLFEWPSTGTLMRIDQAKNIAEQIAYN